MTQTIPPLPPLVIAGYNRKEIDQKTVDRALEILYANRPDLFTRFVEKEKQGVGVEEYDAEFYDLIKNKVMPEVAIPKPNLQVSVILSETMRRARVMYGMTPDPEIDMTTGQYIS